MDQKKVADLIFEAAVVKRIPRTGWTIFGDNKELLGEHIFMTAVIGYFLSRELKADTEEVLIMSLFHDFHEARTGELDKVNLQYVDRHEDKANRDIFSSRDPELLELLSVYEKKDTLESKIVYEANIIALLVELKVLEERGNANAEEWLEGNLKRIKIPEARALAETILQGNTQDWWKDIRTKLHEDFGK